MFETCMGVINMSTMVQIRHLPDDVHKVLKIRALEQGTNLSAFLVRELTRIAKTPTLDDLLERIHQREKCVIQEDSLDALKAERME